MDRLMYDLPYVVFVDYHWINNLYILKIYVFIDNLLKDAEYDDYN